MTSTPPPDGTGERPLEALRAEIVAVVDELDGLDGRPVADHVGVYERLHGVLGEALTAGPDRT